MSSEMEPMKTRLAVLQIFMLAIVALFASTASVGAFEPQSSATPVPKFDRSLRVLTIRIQNYAEPYRQPMSLLHEQIITLNPDLIGFQEAGWTPGEPDQVAQLLDGGRVLDGHGSSSAHRPRSRGLPDALQRPCPHSVQSRGAESAGRWYLAERSLRSAGGNRRRALMNLARNCSEGSSDFLHGGLTPTGSVISGALSLAHKTSALAGLPNDMRVRQMQMEML